MNSSSFEYCHTELDNGVEICHIVSAQKNKTAIAFSIGCGHFDDPKTCQGLTHLLEHMLFMGSKNHPTPNSALKTIEDLGGNINAFTSSETMTIQCHCPTGSTSLVIQTIVDMITSPKLALPDIASEIETIDAEFKFKYQDDLRRLYDVHKSTCNHAHPFSQFSVGNKDVFSAFNLSELQNMLSQQHNLYFIGSNIKICMISDMSFTDFKAENQSALMSLKHKHKIERTPLPALYLPTHLGITIKVKPLIDARRLILTFALPALSIEDRRGLGLLSHILGDENQGSILHFLKSEGWATNLSAGGGIEGRNFKDFNINMQLTENGEQHIDDIIHIVFKYTKLLNVPEPKAWRFEEKLALERLFSESTEISATTEMATSVADDLHQYPFEDLVVLYNHHQQADPKAVRRLLDLFCVENLRVKIISKAVETEHTSAWYAAEYAISPISLDQRQQWQLAMNNTVDLQKLQLPERNPYVFGHAERRNNVVTIQTPFLFWRQSNAELWIAGAPMFKKRMADCYVSFECPANLEGAGILAAKRLWLSCLNDVLQGKYYSAEIAGLNYRLYGHQGGFSIHTSGFSIKQGKLIEELIRHTLQHTEFSRWFELNKESQFNSLKNHLLNKPVNRLFTRLGVLMQRHTHAPKTILEHLEPLTLSQMLDARDAMLSNFSIQGFMHGHWREDDAYKLSNVFDAISFKGGDVIPIEREVAKLSAQYTYFHEVDCTHAESAALLFLQAPSSEPLHIALTMFFEQLLATPFFDELRTKKQLGYVVGSGFVAHNAHPGMVFYVQSPKVDANTLVQEITQFLISQLQHIDYYQQFWQKIQQNMLRQLLAPDVNTSNRAQRLWMNLGLKDFDFNRNTLIAKHIQNLSFDDLISHATALQKRLTFGELVLFSHGNFAHNETFLQRSNARAINDVDYFKQTIPYTN